MATYAQWRRAADTGEVRRVTWICGDQPILVEEVVDHIRRSLAAAELGYVVTYAGTVPDREIWAAAHQYPLNDGARLVIVRDADQLTNWQPLTDWLAAARRLPNNRLVFVSTAHDFPYTMDGRRKAGLRPYVEAIRARGHIVRCAMPNEVDAIAWIRRQAALDEPRARHLLTRTGGNLALAGGVCAKLRLFHGMPNTHTIDALCAEAPTDRFVESVLARHKPAALLAAQRMPPGEYSTVIGLLTARLDLLAALWRSLRTGHPTREVRAAPVFLVQQLQPAAKHYDPERCAYYRRVLAVIEEAHRSGAREALLESLVALW